MFKMAVTLCERAVTKYARVALVRYYSIIHVRDGIAAQVTVMLNKFGSFTEWKYFGLPRETLDALISNFIQCINNLLTGMWES